MDMSDLQLLQLQVNALFTYDAAGHSVAINEPGGGPAPRFFLGRSRVGNLWRIHHELPDTTAQRLAVLAAAEPVDGHLPIEPRSLAAYLEALTLDREVQSVESGPCFRFPDLLPAPAVAVTRITHANLSLLHRMDWDLEALAGKFEAYEPMLALVEDNAAVSLCFSARLTERAAEAGVHTLESQRGHSYAPAVTTAWAYAVRGTGRIPLYSTAWDNHASRAV